VLVVPPRRFGTVTGAGSFARIVSAVDFWVASAVALEAAFDWAGSNGGRLTVVHVVENVPRNMVFSGSEAFIVMKGIRDQVADAAGRLRRKLPSAAAAMIEPRVVTGIPHIGILEEATEAKADLIVMGAPPRTRVGEMVFGSTLRKVLRRTNTPVLVIPVAAGGHPWVGDISGLDRAA